MKPIITRSFLIILSLLFAVAFVACTEGVYDNDRRMRRVVLPAGEVHEGWYFAAGDQVLIEGTVNGDAYVAGGLVEISGTIKGDLLVAGGQVSINGTVTDDIRAAGGNIQFNGKVGKNITTAGGNITIGKPATVSGSLLAACGSLQIAGTTGREAKVFAGDMSVSGNITGNVDFRGGFVSVLQGATIRGNLKARVREKEHVEIAEGTVRGTVDISKLEMKEVRRILGFRPLHFYLKILWMFSLLLTGIIFVLIFPKQLVEIGSTIIRSPGATFLWGIAGIILIPIAAGILMITVLGIPLGLFLLMLYFWMIYLSQLSLGVAVGQKFLGMEGKSRWRFFWVFAVGLLIIQALTFVPYVRPLIIIAGMIFGMGAILQVQKSELQYRRRA